MYVHTRDLAIENLILFVEKIHYPKGIFKYSLIYPLESHTHKYKGSYVYLSPFTSHTEFEVNVEHKKMTHQNEA